MHHPTKSQATKSNCLIEHPFLIENAYLFLLWAMMWSESQRAAAALDEYADIPDTSKVNFINDKI